MLFLSIKTLLLWCANSSTLRRRRPGRGRRGGGAVQRGRAEPDAAGWHVPRGAVRVPGAGRRGIDARARHVGKADDCLATHNRLSLYIDC